MTTNCQHCYKELNLQLPLDIGQRVKCPYCDGLYEVVWLYPLELAPLRLPSIARGWRPGTRLQGED